MLACVCEQADQKGDEAMKSKIRKQEKLIQRLTERLVTCDLNDFTAVHIDLVEQKRILQAMKAQR